jgi:hypothetical protein
VMSYGSSAWGNRNQGGGDMTYTNYDGV